jgi:hypothetical protein
MSRLLAKPPAIVSAQAAPTRHPLVQAVAVSLASAGRVEVTYRTGAETALRVTADSASPSHNLLLTRLRAATTYTYEVRSRSSSGQLGTTVTGTFTTGELPAEFADFEFEATGSPTSPITVVQISTSTNGWQGIVAVDRQGRPVWFHEATTGAMGGWFRANGDAVVIDQGVQVIDALGDTVYSLPQSAGAPYGNIHHGVTNSPSGGLLFVATDPRVVNDTTVVADAIWEWTPETGALVKRWSAHDFLDWTTERGAASAAANWLHTNAISVGAHGNFIVSMRNMNQVLSIAPDWSRVQWRLGGAGATLALVPEDVFSGQHGAREIAPGHLLLFDNGFERTSAGSRVLEFQIDSLAGTATRVWDYTPVPPNFATRLGSVFRFANGNTLIDFGWFGSSPIEVVEVSSTGQLIWKLTPVTDVITKIYHAIPRTTLWGETEVL